MFDFGHRQRLVAKYIDRLTRPILAKYQLHILRFEHDGPSRQMLLDSLHAIARDTGSEQLASCIQSVLHSSHGRPVFGQHKRSSGDARTTHDDGKLGQSQFGHLLLEDARRSFERHKRGHRDAEKFYPQRVEINIVFGNWQEALSLALKSGVPVLIFASAVGAGEFEIASQYCRSIVEEVTLIGPSHNVIVSGFELLHLSVFVALATQSAPDVADLLESIKRVSPWELQELMDLGGHFCARRYAAFGQELLTWEERWNLSIYTTDVAKHLSRCILKNAVLDAARPFARVSFGALAEMLQLETTLLVQFLIENLEERKLNGRINLIQKYFVGNDDGIEAREINETWERTAILRERAEGVAWMMRYKKEQQFSILS